jgi:hypothetical protein
VPLLFRDMVLIDLIDLIDEDDDDSDGQVRTGQGTGKLCPGCLSCCCSITFVSKREGNEGRREGSTISKY